MLIESGHADYCVLHGLHLLFSEFPDVTEICRILEIAYTAESADFFLIMLDEQAAGGHEVEREISTFTRFFRAQKLSELRPCMIGWRTPYWIHARSFWWSIPMPDGFGSKDFLSVESYM